MSVVMLVQLLLFVAIFYFILILPQKREQKRHREMIEALRPGDEVVTAGGLIGEIIQLADDRVTIKSADSRIQMEKVKVSRLLNPRAK